MREDDQVLRDASRVAAPIVRPLELSCVARTKIVRQI